MNALYIVPVYVVLDDALKVLGYQDDSRATVSSAEILTVAVIAARYFHNHHERALCLLQQLHAIPPLSISRFNRRLHQVYPQLHEVLALLSSLRAAGSIYVADTFPLPMCHKVRAERCRKVRGHQYLGRCAAKSEWFYGLRLHWICDPSGFPIAFDLLPAVWHELTPIQYLLADLPTGSRIVADGAYIRLDEEALALAYTGVHLIPQYHARMKRQHTSFDLRLLHTYRPVIETAHSLLHRMGVQHLHARTFDGFVGKVLASLFALACIQLTPTSN